MFFNLSNHEFVGNQLEEAKFRTAMRNGVERPIGKYVKLDFPNINPHAKHGELHTSIRTKWLEVLEIIRERDCNESHTIHVMGEMGFVVGFITYVIRENKYFDIEFVHSCTERKVEEKDGVKKSIFNFVKFREYKIY